MKKIYIAISLILLICLCFVSCNNSNDTDTNTNTNENTNIGENLEGGDTENDNVNEGENPDSGNTENDNVNEGEKPDVGDTENDNVNEGENPDSGNTENDNNNEGENPDSGNTENDNVNEGEKPDVGDTGNDNTIDTSIKVEYDAEREASDNEFPFDNIIVERNGYDIVSAGKYYGDDFDNIIYYGSYYRIIDNYNDFSELTAWGNKIDESVFEDSFVLVLYTYKNYDVYYSPSEFYDFNNLYNRGCFENFEIDKNTNKLKIDETWVAMFFGSPFYGPSAPSIADCEILIPTEKHEIIYLLIPKTDLKDELPINGEIELEIGIWKDE